MAGFLEKFGVTLGGAGEGFLKGGLTAALIGGALFGLPVLAAGIWAATAVSSGFLATLAVVGGVVGSAMSGYVGAMAFAPYGAVIKAPFTAVKRLKEHNRADLENSQMNTMQAQAELADAQNRLTNAVSRSQQNTGGYAQVPMSQQGVPIDNPDARTGHAAAEAKRRNELSQFANLGMG
jgi:hypothetical protein